MLHTQIINCVLLIIKVLIMFVLLIVFIVSVSVKLQSACAVIVGRRNPYIKIVQRRRILRSKYVLLQTPELHILGQTKQDH